MTTTKKRFVEVREILNDPKKTYFAGTLLEKAAKQWPNRTALIYEDKKISFKDLYRLASSITRNLIQKGVKEGDRVLLIYENSINFYASYYGIWQTGAIVTPLNIFLHEKELEHIINDANPSAIIASKKQCEKIKKTSSKIPNIPVFSEEIFIKTQEKNENQEPLTIPQRDPFSCAALLYTSGTTGLPKGVMLSSRNILTNAIQGIINFDIEQNERILAALPLFHSYMQNAAVWSPFLAGATVIVVPNITRKALLKGLESQPTGILGIPQLYGLFCLMKTAPFSQVKYFVSGGDALHNKIRMGFELIYQRKIANGYGLTESSPFISVDLTDQRSPAGSVGKPMPGIEIQIRDEHNAVLEQGERGTLWVKGDNIMLGYYNAPEATSKVIQNNWLNTGDLAYKDTKGAIILCGREKDLIIHKGFNIYPQEIENILTTHPAVFMAGVIGHYENEDEIPIAFVATKNASENLDKQLKELCIQNLAPYKIPHEFHVLTELPMTATGKVDKKILRAKLEKIKNNT